ncbi:MAG TPA: D-2-hydroxyacid dehydrogenase [Acidobacteriota bacterium]|jgi:phosphoglycerate dehydrogenase-like enzyme
MSKESFTRRDFIAGITAAGTATSLSAAAGGASQPLVVHSYPVVAMKAPDSIRIVCAEKLTPEEAEKIRSAGKGVDLVLVKDRSELAVQAPNADVIFGTPDAAVIANAKRLQWVQLWHAGVETVPKEVMDHASVMTNMQRVFAPVIAETAFGLLLGLTRGLVQTSIPAFSEKKWKRGDAQLDDLYHKTMGCVGMGGIGSEIARRAHDGFGMRVLATDAKPLPKPYFVAELHEPGWLMEMVPQVDVLVSCAPLTRETRHLFNESVFRKMKPTAYFINMTRGGLVDQTALARALKEGWFRGAGLDTTTPEPLPSEDPLWNTPNLAITPHNSGQAPIRQVRIIALVAENVRRYTNGLPLLNVVDKTRGY